MNADTSRHEKYKFIFFDGVCHLCNHFVDFLIKRDSNKVFFYAPLQGSTAQQVLQNRVPENLDSLVYSKNGQLFFRSRAVCLILLELPFLWKLCGLIGLCIPTFLGDFVYNIFAKNRYNWFGKNESCRIPQPEEKNYLLP